VEDNANRLARGIPQFPPAAASASSNIATISDPDSGMFSRVDQVDAPVEQA